LIGSVDAGAISPARCIDPRNLQCLVRSGAKRKCCNLGGWRAVRILVYVGFSINQNPYLPPLWPISDETTVQIMLDFYARAFASGNAPQSLVDVQREWLVKLRKEKGLFYAVNRAGPFLMSSQGTAELVATAQE
jgi:hypothetical protein